MVSTFRVGSKTDVKALASAVAHALRNQPEVQLRAIGAASVNQAIKAVIVARGFLAQRGMDLCVVPEFATVDLPDAVVSLVVFTIQQQDVRPDRLG